MSVNYKFVLFVLFVLFVVKSYWLYFETASLYLVILFLFVESPEGFDAVEMVLGGGCLAAAVHGEQGVAHVDAAEG